MFNPSDLDKMLHEKEGRKNRAPFIGLGSFEVTVQKVRMKRDKGQTVLINGQLHEVPGKVLSYIVEARVERSNNPKHVVGSELAVYMGIAGKYEESNIEDALAFVSAVWECRGAKLVRGKEATPEQLEQTKQMIFAILGNPMTGAFDEDAARGYRLQIDTRLPKATNKDGTVKEKAPSEDGFLYKDWRAVPQTAEQIVAQRAALG